ncbi:hypothetical protein BGZ52_012958 [Haplosporangium bisporale]|nr:hypothetical protein BGZ52_012958 [Haplosporangium bisporale]
MDKYKYQDKQKEAVRVKKLADYKAKQAEKEKQAALNGGDNSKKRKPINKASAWSEKVEARERKMERQLKKQRKRDYLKRKANGEIPEGDDTKDGEDEDDNSGEEDGDEDEPEAKNNNNKDEDEDEDDWEELQNEERLAKKVKKGKMTSRDFEKQVGNMFADL